MMPSVRNAAATSARISRPTSNCMPGSVRATMRSENVSTSIRSTPMTEGWSSIILRSRSSFQASSPTRLRTSVTRLTSIAAGTGTSMTARAQSRDRLVTWVIWPFGVVMTSPLTERIRVTRKVTSSTVPKAGSVTPLTEIRTTSPKPY
jgi:hypothetical protein